jgi:hypothetical protein
VEVPLPESRYAPVPDRIVVPAPVAGSVWSFVNDRGELLLVRYVTFTLTTDANVANRTVGVTATAGGDVWFRSGAIATQAASLARNYCGMPAIGASGDSAAAITLPWPGDGLLLRQGHVLAATLANVQVGDAFTAIVLDALRLTPSYPTRLEPMPGMYRRNDEESYSGPGLLSQPGV